MLTEIDQTATQIRKLHTVGQIGWLADAVRHESRINSDCPAYHAISELIQAHIPQMTWSRLPRPTTRLSIPRPAAHGDLNPDLTGGMKNFGSRAKPPRIAMDCGEPAEFTRTLPAPRAPDQCQARAPPPTHDRLPPSRCTFVRRAAPGTQQPAARLRLHPAPAIDSDLHASSR